MNSQLFTLVSQCVKGEKMCEIIFSVEKYVNSQLFTLVSQCVKRWEKVRKVVNSHVKKWEKLWIHMWKYFHTFSQFWPYFSLHCEFTVNSQWREKLWKYFLTLVLTFKGYVLYMKHGLVVQRYTLTGNSCKLECFLQGLDAASLALTCSWRLGLQCLKCWTWVVDTHVHPSGGLWWCMLSPSSKSSRQATKAGFLNIWKI